MHQKAFAGLAAQKGIKGWCRSPHFDVTCDRRGFAQGLGDGAHRIAVIAADHQRRQAAKGWRLAGFTKAAFLLVESVAVTAHQGLHHRVFWIAGLQQNQTRFFRTACPARHLMQQLKSAFARPQVAVTAAQIGIDHADQGQLGEVMAFGDDLRADQHVDLTFGKSADGRLGFGGPMQNIG